MNNAIDLIIGDWSDDGHGRTYTTTITTNLTRPQISELVAKIPEDLKISKYCQEYEDNMLPHDFVKNLELLGIINTSVDLSDYDLVYEGCYIDYVEYLTIFLKILKHLNPGFEYEFTNSPGSLEIGGYGLFS